ncbi:MAG: translocation/assembly module TamB domain-containing protein [Gallionella sp.]|nr:translocation/assembly module TamB domain-containing protein [Gallionella sp.]
MARSFLNQSGLYALRILLGLLAATLLLGWLSSSESSLRWAARQAEQLSNHSITLGTVHGSLYGPLRIEALSFQTDEIRIEAKEINLDWSPLALLERHVKINRLTLQELLITEIKPGSAPIKLPNTLHLPVSFSARDMNIGRIALRNHGAEYAINDIELAMEKLADRYRISLQNMTPEWGKVQADMTLNDTPPFNLSAHASLQQTETADYRAEVKVSGNLSQLLLDGQALGRGGQADLHAVLTPFAALPYSEIQIKTSGINPSLFRKDWPQADIDATVAITPRGGNEMSGNILLRNKLAGSWNQSRSRLPLRELLTRFSGTPDQLELHALRLDLGDAGHFKGSGQLKQRRLQLHLTTTDFNPQGIQSTMRSMRLAGDIDLKVEDDSQQLAAHLRYQRYQLKLDAHHQQDVIALREASISSAASSLVLHGTLALNGPQPFQLSGILKKFNPADFGDYPSARINASLLATGKWAEKPQATLKMTVSDSHFRHQPLSAQGKLSISATRVWDSEIILKLAHNQLTVQGALGNPGDHLNFQIEADKLAMFDPQLSGQIRAKGALEGRLSALSGNFDAQLDNLSWGEDYRLTGLHASGRLDRGADGPLLMDASLQGLTSPQLSVTQVSLNAQGTRLKHTLNIRAKSHALDVETRLVGGWNDRSGWSGQVMNLLNRGRHALELKSPAKLELARQHIELNNARFDFNGADLTLHELTYEGGHIASRGEFTGLPLTYLQGIAGQDGDPGNDLTLGGNWQFTIKNSVNGQIDLWRVRGDVPLSSNPPTMLGLSRLTLNLKAVNNQLQAQLEAAGSKLGSIKAEAHSTLSARDGVWGIASSAPLRASLDMSVETLAWLPMLIDKSETLTFDGALNGSMRADGTFARPNLTGRLDGTRISVALPEQGLRFTEGHFQSQLQNQVLYLNDLAMRGGTGSLKGRGQLDFTGKSPTMQLAVQADKLEVLSRPDRYLKLSGTGDAAVSGREIHITANLKADRGLIELQSSDLPTASDDVVVITGLSRPAEQKARPYAIKLDLDMDLGENFFVKGQGLDAQLGGALKLSAANGASPISRGSVRVTRGSYSAYGQRLEIERGILNFQGPLDNPSLNILAWRKNQTVEAGVALTGTAQSPRVNLVSSPDVPDSKKLSWLVLGHDLEASDGQDFSAMQAAAGALLAGSDSISLQQKIAHAAGLEEVSIKGAGGLESSMLTLGKRLSSRAYLSYEQGLTGVGTLMKINYTLTKRLSAQAQAGTTPAVDLFYTFSFD